MDAAAIAHYIRETFPEVETTENYGYTFFFYGTDRMLPFATLATKDQPFDQYSNLSRRGVYRLNIGISHDTFRSLFGPGQPDLTRYDFTALDKILPHPEYAAQNFICVLSPGKATLERVRSLLAEAHGLAVERDAKRRVA